MKDLDALILAVPHKAYKALDPAAISAFFRKDATPFVFDIKGFFDKQTMLDAGIDYQRL